MIREYTNKVIELAESGIVTWETIARAAVQYMSEDDVKDMAISNEIVEDEEEEEEA